MSDKDMLKDYLQRGALQTGVRLTGSQLNSFLDYLMILKEWNRVMNLTAIEEDEAIIEKHFIDSLLCARFVSDHDHTTVLDVGTGAGFPGIPLKIWDPRLHLSLLDSTEKKAKFLQTACNELNLAGVKIVQARAEEAGRDARYREMFDRVVARAVARLDILAEYCLPFTKIGGLWIALKGPGITEELLEAKAAINILGGEIRETMEFRLPFSGDTRVLSVVDKVKTTPGNYPRRSGKPKKYPLGQKH
ncbi:MAG: 16S rRNA (guanine(527)-N(7))-methyltransferase RsmG [Bacillota bacterium]